MKASLFYLPSIASRAEIEQGMAGMNPHYYQRMLKELTIEKMEAAGSGGTAELLAWVIVMGAIGQRPGHSYGYAICTDFRCGIGAVSWKLAA